MKKKIIYYYRGMIERGPNYEWKKGYSTQSENGFPLYPWGTKRECQPEAKSKGAKAVFVYEKTRQIA